MSANVPPDRLAPGITREFLCDGQIAVFTLFDMAEDTVDAWIAECLRIMEDCDAHKRPLLILQDLARPAVMQTAYSRERGNTVTNAFPGLPGRVAFVLSEGMITATRIGRFVRWQRQEFRERKTFPTREDAVEWLKELLPGG